MVKEIILKSKIFFFILLACCHCIFTSCSKKKENTIIIYDIKHNKICSITFQNKKSDSPVDSKIKLSLSKIKTEWLYNKELENEFIGNDDNKKRCLYILKNAKEIAIINNTRKKKLNITIRIAMEHMTEDDTISLNYVSDKFNNEGECIYEGFSGPKTIGKYQFINPVVVQGL